MDIIKFIGKALGLVKEEPKKKRKEVVSKTIRKPVEAPKLNRIEKILHDGSEMDKTILFHELAHDKGNTDDQIYSRLENGDIEKQKTHSIRFEFIPRKQSYRNVRSFLEYREAKKEREDFVLNENSGIKTNFANIKPRYLPWKKIRDTVEKYASEVCSICLCSSKSLGKNYHTECHEVWKYYVDDKKRRIQKLMDLQALCSMCHQIKHANQYEHDNEYLELLLTRYSEINNIDFEDAKKEYESHKFYLRRKDYLMYKLDLSYLEKFDVEGVEELFDCHDRNFDLFVESWKTDKEVDLPKEEEIN